MDVQGPLVASVTAIGIGAINTFAGYLVAKFAFGKDLNTFLAFVFASFGIRALVVIGLAFYLLTIVEMHQVAFALSFSISGFVFMMGEILFFHRSFEQMKRDVRPPVAELLKKNFDRVIHAN